jgi:methionyl aminopeptidase
VIVLKTNRELEIMRTAGRMVAEILTILREHIRPGVTTMELEELALAETKKRKAIPAFKGYAGFPFALCCSPNRNSKRIQ